MSDPGALFVTCRIKDQTFLKCLCDTGASVSIMPVLIAIKLGLYDFTREGTRIRLADNSTTSSLGMLENVPIHVGGCVVPTDFVVVRMSTEPSYDFILGRSFLLSTDAQINISQGTVSLNFQNFRSSLFTRDGYEFDGPPKHNLPLGRAWWYEDKGKRLQLNSPYNGSSENEGDSVNTLSYELPPRRKKTPSGERRSSRPHSRIVMKRDDPGALNISCQIREGTFTRCLCDTGASINVMPLHVARYLGFQYYSVGRLNIMLADQSVATSCGVLNNVLVRVSGVVVPTDFTIMEMSSRPDYDLIFGRPFLLSTGAQVDILQGTVLLRFRNIKSVLFTKDGREFDVPLEPTTPIATKCSQVYEYGEGSNSYQAADTSEYTVNVISPATRRNLRTPQTDRLGIARPPRSELIKSTDPGPFFISCKIGEVTLSKCLIDTGASVNVMPMQVARFLSTRSWKYKEESSFLKLSDQSVVRSITRVEDLQVEIGGVNVPTDFTLMNMHELPDFNLILGRPFLATTQARIDLTSNSIVLNLGTSRKRVFTRNGLEFDERSSTIPPVETPSSSRVNALKDSSPAATERSMDTLPFIHE